MRKAIFVLIMLVALSVEISHQQAGGDDDHGMNPYPDVLPTTNCQSLPDYFKAEALNNLNTRFGCSFEFVRAESIYKDVSRRSLYQFFKTQSAQLANGSCPLCTRKQSLQHEPEIHYSNAFLMRQNWFLEYSAHFLFAKYRCPFNMSTKIAIEDLPVIGNKNLGTLPELAGCDSYFAVTSMKLRPDGKQEDSVAFLVQSLTTTNDLLRTWNDTDYAIASASHYGCAIIVKDKVNGISGLGEALQNDRAAYLACLFIAYDSLVSYRGDLNYYTCDRNYGLAEYINSVQTTLCVPISIELIPEDVPFDIACEEKHDGTEIKMQPATTSEQLSTPSAEFSVVSTTPFILLRTSAVISPERLASTISVGSDTRWTSIKPTEPAGINMSRNEEQETKNSQWRNLLTRTSAHSTGTAIISPEQIVTVPAGSNAEWMTNKSEKWRAKMKPVGEWRMQHSKRPDLFSETALPFTETGIRTSEDEGYGMQNLLLPNELVVSSSEITTLSTERTFTVSPDAEWITVRSEMEKTEPKPADIITSENQEWGLSNLPRQDLTTKSTVSSAATTIISSEQTATISEVLDADWIKDRTGNGSMKAKPAGMSTFKSEDWGMWNSKRRHHSTEPAVPFTETAISTSRSERYAMLSSRRPSPRTETDVPTNTISPEWTVTISPDAEWITVRWKEEPTQTKPGGISTFETKEWGMSNSPPPVLTTESTISSAKNTIKSPEWSISISGSDVKLVTITPNEGLTKATLASISTSENEEWEAQNSQHSDPFTSTSLPSTKTTIISPERNTIIPARSEAEWVTTTSEKLRTKMKLTRISISKNQDWRMRTSEGPNLPTEPTISLTETTRRASKNEEHVIQNSQRPDLPMDSLASPTKIAITSTERTVSISPVTGWITVESEKGQTKAIPTGISPSGNEEWVTRTLPQSDLLTSTPGPSTGTAIISSERIATTSTIPEAEWITITSGKWWMKAKPTSIGASKNENWTIRSTKRPAALPKSTVSFTKTGMRTSKNERDGMQTSQSSDPPPDSYVPSTEIRTERTVTISSVAEWVMVGSENGRTKPKPVSISTSKSEEWAWQENLTTKATVSSAETATTTIPEGSDAKLVTDRPEKGQMEATPVGIRLPENEDWVRQNSPRPDVVTSTSVPSTETTNISPARIATISTGLEAEWATLTLGKSRTKTKPASISTSENEDQRMWYSKWSNIPPESAVPLIETGMRTSKNEEYEKPNSQRPFLLTRTPVPSTGSAIISPERMVTIYTRLDTERMTSASEKWGTKTKPAGISKSENEDWRTYSEWPGPLTKPASLFTETGIRTSKNEGSGIKNSQWPDLSTVPLVPSTDITIVSTERTVTISDGLNAEGITVEHSEGSTKGALTNNSISGIELWVTLNSQRPDRLTSTPVPPTGTAIISPEWTGTVSAESDTEWMTGKWRTKMKPAGVSTSKNEDRGIWTSEPPDLPLEPTVPFTETGLRTTKNQGYGIPIVSTERTVSISDGLNAEGITVERSEGSTKGALTNNSISGIELWVTPNSQRPDRLTSTPVPPTGTAIISPEWTGTISAESDTEWMTGKWRTKMKPAGVSTSKNDDRGIWKSKPPDLPIESTVPSTETGIRTTENQGYGIPIVSTERTVTNSLDTDGITVKSGKWRTKVKPADISTSKTEEWGMLGSPGPDPTFKSTVTQTVTETSDAVFVTVRPGEGLSQATQPNISSSGNEEWVRPYLPRQDLTQESTLTSAETGIIFTEQSATISDGLDAEWITDSAGNGSTKSTQPSISVSENQWSHYAKKTPVPFTIGTAIISPESKTEWMTNTSGTWRIETKLNRINTSENEEWKMQSWQRPDDERATGKPEPSLPFTGIAMIPPESTSTVSVGSNTKWITTGLTDRRTGANPVGFSVSKNEEWILQNSQQPDLPAKPSVSSTETVIISTELISEGSDAKRITIAPGKGRTKSKLAGISSTENKEWKVLNSQSPGLLANSSLSFMDIAIVSADRATTISERSDVEWITVGPGKGATEAIPAGVSPYENVDRRTPNSQRPDLFEEPLTPAEETTIISPEQWTSKISETLDTEVITIDTEVITIEPGEGNTDQFEEQREQVTFLPDDLPRDRFDDKYKLPRKAWNELVRQKRKRNISTLPD